MAFPESPRVIYSKNPLDAVFCQLRYPTILRINSFAPAEFQEQIRAEYPLYQKTSNFSFVSPRVMQHLATLTTDSFETYQRIESNSVYEFIAADENWKIDLASSFMVLNCQKYTRWDDFKAHLVTPARALAEIYHPAFLNRIGLRYQDIIKRSWFGLDDVPWTELLQPYIAGELTAPAAIVGSIEQMAHQIVIRLDYGEVNVNHGLIIDGDGEQCYMIDSDFYLQAKTDINEMVQVLDSFNTQSARLFRWCITDTLHNAMGPEAIP